MSYRGPFLTFIARIGFLSLLLFGLSKIAAGAEPAASGQQLQPAQKEALLELIRSLEKLKVQPESSPAIAQWITEETQRSEAELKTLETQLADIQQKKQALVDRLAALRVGQNLLGLTTSQPAIAAATPAAPAPPASQPTAVSSDPQIAFFQQNVRTVLENQCFDCHGGKFKKGGLDLSTRETLLHGGDTGPAAAPGNAEGSLLYKLITHSQDPHMPAKAPKLADPVIASIAQWLNSGAPYDKPLAAPQGKQATAVSEKPKHWAFVPPIRPTPPPVKNAAWVRNPIDAFVLAKLEASDLMPSAEADRRTLIRRLSLDLIGLPPKSSEVDEFVNDQRPDAYERLVDRLLSSPHYGERWGRYWLDVARYADSDGYEKDEARPYAWRWRDWVIDAINHDLPFDQFTTEQLAGDLLPNAGIEQKVATGFHRNTLVNKEGGVDQEEYRNKAVVDRVSTTGTVWLGLTVGCAECHTHKFDPITQREFYQLFAFFNTADDASLPAPLPKDVDNYTKAKQAFDAKQSELTAALAAFDKEQLPARQAAWEAKTLNPAVKWTVLEPLFLTTQNGTTLTRQADNSILATGKNTTETYIVTAETDLNGITAVKLEALTDASLPSNGPGRESNGNFVLAEFQAQIASADNPGQNEPIVFEKAIADHFQTDRPWRIEHTIDGKPETGWAVLPQVGKDHVAIYETRQDIATGGKPVLTFRLDFNYDANHTLGKFRLSVTNAKRPVPLELLPQEIVQFVSTDSAQRTAEQSAKLTEYYRGIDEERIKLQKAIDEHIKTKPAAPEAQVLAETNPPRKTHIHTRGDFLRKGAEVEPATLAVLHPFKPRGPEADRLDLARWLFDPSNPLTARVTVNRMWQYLFGRGLVLTQDDFGTRSEPPSHPELLDWLATEMIARGWSRKAMIKLIVESATYRQSSRMRPELLERDPKNILLARQSRFRLEAEIVRDSNLASSGLLHDVIGGPSIRPPLPADVAALGYAGSITWPASPAPDKYRRGMYIFFQRTVPYPMLSTFDAPDSNVTCTRRERSNTPLQSLTLLNSPEFFECAQTLGLNAMKEKNTPDERIRYMFKNALAREPDDQEISYLEQLWKEIDAMCRGDETAAAKMVGEPQVKLVSGQLTDAAGWIAVARTILNLDEFVTRE